MASESFSAAAGAFATLDSQARADEATAGPIEHVLGPIYGAEGGDRFGICEGCGRRIDGADVAQVTRLHEAHVVMEREAVERAQFARTAPDGLARARAALAETAARKGRE